MGATKKRSSIRSGLGEDKVEDEEAELPLPARIAIEQIIVHSFCMSTTGFGV